MRNAIVERTTGETNIKLSLFFDTAGKSNISTGVGFFDHMLNSFAKHSNMKINLNCDGDLEVDDHHTVEDVGICLGLAFKQAIGDKKGITRFGFASIPMDEALCQTSIDISGRGHFVYKGDKLKGYLKDYNLEMTNEFFYAFAQNAQITLHVNLLYGENSHHIVEAIFKSVARAIKHAIMIDENNKKAIPSTKGTL